MPKKSKAIPKVKSNRKRYHFGIKFDSEGWYKNPKMAGHTWAKESLDRLEAVMNLYCKSKLQKWVIDAIYGTPEEIRNGEHSWNYFCNNVTKKDVATLQFVLRKVDKCKDEENMYSLLRNVDRKSGMLKSRLTWVLEHLSYEHDRKAYLKGYIAAFGFYGMNPLEAAERFENYHTSISEKLFS